MNNSAANFVPILTGGIGIAKRPCEATMRICLNGNTGIANVDATSILVGLCKRPAADEEQPAQNKCTPA